MQLQGITSEALPRRQLVYVHHSGLPVLTPVIFSLSYLPSPQPKVSMLSPFLIWKLQPMHLSTSLNPLPINMAPYLMLHHFIISVIFFPLKYILDLPVLRRRGTSFMDKFIFFIPTPEQLNIQGIFKTWQASIILLASHFKRTLNSEQKSYVSLFEFLLFSTILILKLSQCVQIFQTISPNITK